MYLFLMWVFLSEVRVGTFTTRYPVFYRDVSYMSMFLLASPEKVKNILPSKRMNPFRLTPCNSMITITATDGSMEGFQEAKNHHTAWFKSQSSCLLLTQSQIV